MYIIKKPYKECLTNEHVYAPDKKILGCQISNKTRLIFSVDVIRTWSNFWKLQKFELQHLIWDNKHYKSKWSRHLSHVLCLIASQKGWKQPSDQVREYVFSDKRQLWNLCISSKFCNLRCSFVAKCYDSICTLYQSSGFCGHFFWLFFTVIFFHHSLLFLLFSQPLSVITNILDAFTIIVIFKFAVWWSPASCHPFQEISFTLQNRKVWT